MSTAIDCKVIGNLTNTDNATECRVGSQPDILQGSAAQNKKAFDDYCDMIATRHNQLCDYVDTQTAAVVDPQVLLLFASDGWVLED